MSTNKKSNVVAQKAWIALQVGEIPFELKEVSLYGPGGKPGWFWELNPDGTVPVLETSDGRVFPDSELILDHVDDASESMSDGTIIWRKTLLPRKLLPIGKTAVLSSNKQNVDKLFRLLSEEIDPSIEGPFLCGESPTTADCAAFPFLWRLDQEFGPFDSQNGCAQIRTWLDHCGKIPAFSTTIQGAWWWWW
eukprot:CAMPEP_0118695018 /NCGR_PEP_ID=MMETSP0800-20121206/12915_1 /TAXON_ID=210618 ORGANISM="Striatella unipunctata, Strain CCMP2910" /NCGR_SAMPLE_ID=MMETSP0800 /ASSEMBLY_ACC=CAM_ASM_000638 /LENGTH=191 /DNA_ID=CAMNT_0006593687 /DNA_START=89 /DNA_END=665 /DNA_ORIENTATION=+